MYASPATHLTDDGHAKEGVGRLEYREWARLLWALGACEDVISTLVAYGDTSPSNELVERVHTSSTPPINMPASHLAIDEIRRHQDVLDGFRTLEGAVNDQRGSFAAIEFGRAVSMADRRWPNEEKDHPMMAMRCGGCDEMTLLYRPPRFFGDRIEVDCPKCGYSLTEDEFSVAALLIEAELNGSTTAREEAADAV